MDRKEMINKILAAFAGFKDEEIASLIKSLAEPTDMLGQDIDMFISLTLSKVNEYRQDEYEKSERKRKGNALEDIYVLKKDFTRQDWDSDKIVVAISRADERSSQHITDEEIAEVVSMVESKVLQLPSNVVDVKDVHAFVEEALREVCPPVANCYIEYRSLSRKWAKVMDNIFRKSSQLLFIGDKSNSNADSALASTITCIMASYLGTEMYVMQFLTAKERQAAEDGYIYIHDKDKRYFYPYNCTLFNYEDLLRGIKRDEHGEIIEDRGGFEMANVWYNTPKTLDVAFDVIGDVCLSAASQQYGGHTIPNVDILLAPYAERSYEKYLKEYAAMVEDCGGAYDEAKADAFAEKKVQRDFMQGFQGWEYKFNTVASSRGDYPFITVSGGTGTGRWEKMAWTCAMRNHAGGQGKEGHKKATMFPKYVFLYDEEIHGKGKECEDVFLEGIECSSKAMYPDWLSLSGEGYIASMYKKYKKSISPMGCRAFLSPWYLQGGMTPASEEDEPVFVGRFNIGAISLHLPMIYQKSVMTGQDFFEVLDYYMEMIRGIHQRTYDFISKIPASRAPLAFCEGGLYGGNLGYDQKIGDNPVILKAATASFGVTALNELNHLATGKEYVEDNSFALKTLQYINAKVTEFKKEDGHLYAVYGTPAESLCGRQITQFRKAYGVIPGVSDREYVTNSFHVPVWEDIDPFTKQDLERPFWEEINGGKIQYVKYPVNYNKEGYIDLIRRAMAFGFYEGCNTSISYCEDCGEQHINLKGDTCPKCGSKNLTNIDRMNGYLSYSRVKGATRLNDAKMAEIAERVSM